MNNLLVVVFALVLGLSYGALIEVWSSNNSCNGSPSTTTTLTSGQCTSSPGATSTIVSCTSSGSTMTLWFKGTCDGQYNLRTTYIDRQCINSTALTSARITCAGTTKELGYLFIALSFTILCSQVILSADWCPFRLNSEGTSVRVMEVSILLRPRLLWDRK